LNRLALIFGVVGVSGLLQLGVANAAAQPHWGYTGHGGPDSWGELSEKFHTCAAGVNQSPIDVSGSVEAKLPAIGFAYQGQPREIVNNGHTVQVNVAPGSYITVDGQQFELKQYHFHTPSENLIEGKQYPLEAHLVHADARGNLAVVAVMFEQGSHNAVLAQLWDELPRHGGEQHALAAAPDLDALLPQDRSYYRFNGSLTTPPCSEGVRWLVLSQPLSIDSAQVDAFAAAVHGHNNRPVQPLHARIVLH